MEKENLDKDMLRKEMEKGNYQYIDLQKSFYYQSLHSENMSIGCKFINDYIFDILNFTEFKIMNVLVKTIKESGYVGYGEQLFEWPKRCVVNTAFYMKDFTQAQINWSRNNMLFLPSESGFLVNCLILNASRIRLTKKFICSFGGFEEHPGGIKNIGIYHIFPGEEFMAYPLSDETYNKISSTLPPEEKEVLEEQQQEAIQYWALHGHFVTGTQLEYLLRKQKHIIKETKSIKQKKELAKIFRRNIEVILASEEDCLSHPMVKTRIRNIWAEL